LPLFILAFLLPIYAQELGASASDIGGLFAVFSIAMMGVRPFVGLAIDRYGRRSFLLAGLCTYVLAMVVFTLSDTLIMLYLARLIQGVGAALTWIATYTIAAELATSGQRGEAIGEADGAGERGAVYGAIAAFGIMAWLPLRTGWMLIFMAYTACAIIGVWLAWRRVPETKSSIPAPVPEAAVAPSKPSLSETLSWGLCKLLFIVFLTKASQALVNPLLLIFLRDRFGLALWQLAIAYLPAALILGFLPGRMGRLSDRLGRVPMMVTGLVISAATSLTMPSLSSLGWFVAIFALNALGIVTATPAQKAMVGDLTKREHWGRAFGLYTFAASLGTAGGPLLGGVLYDQAGQVTPFYANAALLVVSALWTMLMLRSSASSAPGFSLARGWSRALQATSAMARRIGKV
jgi:MFS family permease